MMSASLCFNKMFSRPPLFHMTCVSTPRANPICPVLGHPVLILVDSSQFLRNQLELVVWWIPYWWSSSEAALMFAWEGGWVPVRLGGCLPDRCTKGGWVCLSATHWYGNAIVWHVCHSAMAWLATKSPVLLMLWILLPFDSSGSPVSYGLYC